MAAVSKKMKQSKAKGKKSNKNKPKRIGKSRPMKIKKNSNGVRKKVDSNKKMAPKRPFSTPNGRKSVDGGPAKKKKVSFGQSPKIDKNSSSDENSGLKSILKSRKPTPKKVKMSPKMSISNAKDENSINYGQNSEKPNFSGSTKEFRMGKKMTEKLAVLSRKDRKSYIKQLKQAKKPNYELALKAKIIWEQIRKKKLSAEEKEKLTSQLYGLVEGKAKQMIFAHDTVRVMQCLMALKNADVRTKLFEELKEEILEMSKSKYSKFFVIKMLKYGTPQQRMHVMKSFFGKIVDLMKHTVACDVVQYAYNEYANALQRAQIATEFYSAEYQIFKVEEPLSLKDILAKEPQKKETILKTLSDHILSISSKAAMKHSLMHRLCLEFFENCDNENTRTEVIDCIKERVPEMLHTKDGTLCSMYCVWFGTVKDRKAIVKCLKNFVTKICQEEHGHMLLPAIFDTIDDTVAVTKTILQEMKKNLATIIVNKFGVKVIHYLLNPRDPRHFNKQYVAILSIGDSNMISKKSKETKHEELLKEISPDLLEYASENAREMIFDTNFPLLIVGIYEFCLGNKTEAYKSLCEILSEEFIPCNVENMHLIEHPRGHFVLKSLLKRDRNLHKENRPTLSEFIIEELPEENLESWLSCNKGAFILTIMLESGVKKVEDKILQLVERNKKKLSKYSFAGAKILLDKLNNVSKI